MIELFRNQTRPAEPFFGEELERVAHFYDSRPELEPTQLRSLPRLAARARVGELLVKDESTRFGLNAFKCAGAMYAVHRLMETRGVPSAATLVCASAGNHGRAVAHVARRNELAARVYMAATTKPAPIAAIRGEGAEVVLVDGTYDDAVRQAADDAERNGWWVVSDTAWPGYEEIPRWIMAGYTRIFEEARRQWARRPDLFFVQAGVGSLAAAAVAWLVEREPDITSIICEPDTASPLLASARAGRVMNYDGVIDTIMAGLGCAEPSSIAVPVLNASANWFAAISDDDTREAMRALAADGVVSGPSGAAGVGTLLAIQRDGMMDIGADSVVLALSTEGATDRELYDAIVGEGA